jgi:hypothetical protein
MPINCRCSLNVQRPVNNPVSCPRPVGSQADFRRTFNKEFHCLVPGVAVQYLRYFSASHFLILRLATQAETRTAGSGSRNRFLDHFLSKATASSLPWIPLWPGEKMRVTLFLVDKTNSLLTLPDQLRRYPFYPKGLQSCLAIWANMNLLMSIQSFVQDKIPNIYACKTVRWTPSKTEY